ncbi:MAG: DUF2804 family protein [Spirochaetaceae bacterium]|nr:DUF2804 family protein [Spirochaetaceae bacterium]
MYSREITDPPKKLVKNGKPVFGTFLYAPAKLDIKGVEQPFGVLPLPSFITDLRIRSTLFFVFNCEEYIGIIDFFDARLFGHAEVILWEKGSGRKLAYRAIIGPRKRLVPKTTAAGVCVSLNRNRYIRITWDLNCNRLSVVMDLKGDSARPSVSVAFNADISPEKRGYVSAVLPAPIMRRCRALWMLSSPFVGHLNLKEAKGIPQTAKQAVNGSILFEIYKAYYSFKTKSISAISTGVYKDKNFSFSITSSSLKAVDPDKYNENFLFYDNETTLLPPVKITYPYGIKGTWVIQDTENMVDLTFSPLSDHSRTISIFILRTQSHSIYGTFSGVIQTKNGENITLKEFPGIVRKQLMRL